MLQLHTTSAIRIQWAMTYIECSIRHHSQQFRLCIRRAELSVSSRGRMKIKRMIGELMDIDGGKAAAVNISVKMGT